MADKLVFLLFIFLLTVPLSYSTLSKTSPTGSHSSEEDSGEDNARRSKLQEYAEHGLDEDSMQEILENHGYLDTGDPNRSFIKLGYVTPWNNHGYDVAKWAAKKFTHISPVWFYFTPKLYGKDLACEITGQHDIDQGWIDDIRLNNTEVKIVPRFLLQIKDVKLADAFLKDHTAQIRCVDAMNLLLKKMNADGLVLEAFLQIVASTNNEEAIGKGTEFIGRAGRRLKKHKKISIVPLTPPIVDEQPVIRADVLTPLYKDVDYINLMTYDYNGQQFNGLAPAPWIILNLEYLKQVDEEFLEKTILGVNYYGLCKGTRSEHIFGQKVIDILEENEGVLLWDENTQQHQIEIEDAMCSVPTKRSLSIRLDMVEEYKLAGVGIWDLGQGFDHFTEIL